DPYEVDDQQGVPFSVGGTQARTFYPQGDVDKVFFTAKVAHRYAVFTEQLDAGVDTVLFATMGAVQTANDNRAPGDPSSYLELFNDTAQDLTAQIAITNQGQYGVDKRYVLVIRDLGVEGLDSYEPDLTVLRSIALNEVQRHNFYPPGDIDRVVLQVTAGQRYAVFTCGNDGSSPLPIHSTDPFFPYTLNCAPLAPGVDTFLVVSGPVRRCIPESCQSENVPQNEFPSYTNSRVEFDAIQNGQVSITLFNRGNFGPNQFYFLRAYAVDPLPTQTPSPTRTSTPSLTPTQALASPTATATATEVATPTPTFTATETATAMPTPIFTATETAVPTPTATSSTPYPPGPTPTSGWGYPSAQERLAMWGGRPLAAPWPQAMAPIGGGGTIRFTLLLRMREKGP
ncbi:MAG: hypothetical protein H5T69_14605, partial [Chloroflexi bacterium]|nr:hypothetical protein [Chloroflexota bacterium]